MKYVHQLLSDQRGLATAEYAVATVAALILEVIGIIWVRKITSRIENLL